MANLVRALVTGGSGFIGSNLVDALVARGDEVTVIDDLSTGKRENLDAAIDAGAELADTGGLSIAQVLLDVAMAPLLGVQIGGIGRQPVHLDLRTHTQILLDHRGAMGIESVPDNDEGAGNVALEVAEGEHHGIAANGMREVSLVDAAR